MSRLMHSLLQRFRARNARLNERVFGSEANSFRRYLALVDAALPSEGTILDLGAGRVSLAQYLPRLRAERLAIAVDQDHASLIRNPLESRIAAQAEMLPFRDETIDVIASSCCFEHVEHPTALLRESYRVLTNGGALVFYTPSRRSYVAMIGRLTPVGFHRWIRTLQTGAGSDEVEVCRTLYRMNSETDLIAQRDRFHVASLGTYIGAPCYTTFLPPPLHAVFVGLHLIIQRVPWLTRTFGESVIGCFLKIPDGAAAAALGRAAVAGRRSGR